MKPAADLGLDTYLTTTSGIGGKLRTEVEDFVVEEVALPLPRREDGPFWAATVTATNWETNRLVSQLARKLGISRNRIFFAGTKDRRAITSQRMVFSVKRADPISVSLHEVTLEDQFRTPKKLGLGDLLGNRFDIRLRDARIEGAQETRQQISDAGGFPAFYGPQRFGTLRPITHRVGGEIIKGDLREAVWIYLCAPGQGENENHRIAREQLRQSEDLEAALRDFPERLNFELMMLNHLVKKPDDWKGALLQLPWNLLLMFIHAFQARIFNLILEARIRQGIPLHEVEVGDLFLPVDKNGLPQHRDWKAVTRSNLPLITRAISRGEAFSSGMVPGQATEGPRDTIQAEIEATVLETEKVRPEDFEIPEIPRLSTKGVRRELRATVSGLAIEEVGESDLRFSFELQKGNYATSLLREFMKTDDLRDY